MPCPLCGKTIGHKKWCSHNIDNHNYYDKLDNQLFDMSQNYMKETYRYEDPYKTLRKDPSIVDLMPGPKEIPPLMTEQPNLGGPPTGMIKNYFDHDTGFRATEGGLIKNTNGVMYGKIDNDRQIFNDVGHRVGSVNLAGQILDINGIPTGEFIFK